MASDIDRIVKVLRDEAKEWAKESPPDNIGAAQVVAAALASVADRLAAEPPPGVTEPAQPAAPAAPVADGTAFDAQGLAGKMIKFSSWSGQWGLMGPGGSSPPDDVNGPGGWCYAVIGTSESQALRVQGAIARALSAAYDAGLARGREAPRPRRWPDQKPAEGEPFLWWDEPCKSWRGCDFTERYLDDAPMWWLPQPPAPPETAP